MPLRDNLRLTNTDNFLVVKIPCQGEHHWILQGRKMQMMLILKGQLKLKQKNQLSIYIEDMQQIVFTVSILGSTGMIEMILKIILSFNTVHAYRKHLYAQSPPFYPGNQECPNHLKLHKMFSYDHLYYLNTLRCLRWLRAIKMIQFSYMETRLKEYSLKFVDQQIGCSCALFSNSVFN